jgi:hypothetical protein
VFQLSVRQPILTLILCDGPGFEFVTNILLARMDGSLYCIRHHQKVFDQIKLSTELPKLQVPHSQFSLEENPQFLQNFR